jgi:hypothetical protein
MLKNTSTAVGRYFPAVTSWCRPIGRKDNFTYYIVSTQEFAPTSFKQIGKSARHTISSLNNLIVPFITFHPLVCNVFLGYRRGNAQGTLPAISQ